MARYQVVGSEQNKDSNIVIKGKFVTASSKHWSWYADDNVTFRKVSNSSKPKSHYKSHSDYVGRKPLAGSNSNRKTLYPITLPTKPKSLKLKARDGLPAKGF